MLATAALNHEASLGERPMVVFFEDEARFGRIGSEIGCRVRRDVFPKLPGKWSVSMCMRTVRFVAERVIVIR